MNSLETNKIKLLNLPKDILTLLCSIYPKLGLTCKTLYNLCPPKPPEYFYDNNKYSKYMINISYFPTDIPNIPTIPYYYYQLDINHIVPIIESKKFQLLQIKVPNDIVYVTNTFKYVYENNISIEHFKYKYELKLALKDHLGEKQNFIHLDKFDSLTMSFLMYLYH